MQSVGDSALSDLFQSKIKAEWEALKNKDKKAYGGFGGRPAHGVGSGGRLGGGTGERVGVAMPHTRTIYSCAKLLEQRSVATPQTAKSS